MEVDDDDEDVPMSNEDDDDNYDNDKEVVHLKHGRGYMFFA